MMNKEDMNNIGHDQELTRKRKNRGAPLPERFPDDVTQEDDKDFLSLSLTFRPPRPITLSSPPVLLPSPLQLPPAHPIYMSSPILQDPSSSKTITTHPPLPPPFNVVVGGGAFRRPIRPRRNPNQAPREGKSETVPIPFPWATHHRATVQSLSELQSKQIAAISGEVQCKKCETRFEIEYDLAENFIKVGNFIAQNRDSMHDRAPNVWLNPILPTCKFCENENCLKPIISPQKKSINWLFLLLGQLLGCCTLSQLKYFCKHTKNHRTGAKDRVLYLTYLGICKQLDPNGPFGR